MRSKYPDEYQRTHRKAQYVDPSDIDKMKLPKKLEIKDEPSEQILITTQPEFQVIATTEELQEKTIRIREGETGFSYKSLFGPYMKGASKIDLADPYIRLEFQIRNLLAFVGIIDTVEGPVSLHLITGAEDEYQKRINGQKFDEIAASVQDHGITFTYEFSDTIHRRGIELDNGWRIIIDRGLDIFQKPDSKYELSELDQTKRKCRETEIVYLRSDNSLLSE